jgi:response regulator of citrate/malate metabolism
MNNEISEAVISQCRRIFEKTKRGATVSEIARNLARRKYDRKRLIEVIETLVKFEAIEVYVDQAGSKVGRPTKRYKYVG